VFVSSAKSDGMATLSLSRIGELAGMSKPAASGHVGRLVQAGYLEPGTTSRRCGTRYRLTNFAGYIGEAS
jgi:DNA-binding IclR family transcriptional regulator